MRAEPRKTLSRFNRRLIRTKGRKPCDECRRWTEVPPPDGMKWSELPTFKSGKRKGGSWEEVFTSNRRFVCNREVCIRSRPETM